MASFRLNSRTVTSTFSRGFLFLQKKLNSLINKNKNYKNLVQLHLFSNFIYFRSRIVLLLNLKRERNHQLYSAGTPDYLKDILFEIPALFALTWNCCLNSFLLSLFLIFNSINIIQKFPKINNMFPKINFFHIFLILVLTNGNVLDIL